MNALRKANVYLTIAGLLIIAITIPYSEKLAIIEAIVLLSIAFIAYPFIVALCTRGFVKQKGTVNDSFSDWIPGMTTFEIQYQISGERYTFEYTTTEANRFIVGQEIDIAVDPTDSSTADIFVGKRSWTSIGIGLLLISGCIVKLNMS